MARKPDPRQRTKLTRRERRKADREEYRAALKDFRGFSPDNETREYYEARARLVDADRRRKAWWR